MRIFCDENVPAAVVAGLRAAGHDVAWGADFDHGADDVARTAYAEREGRVILTEDKDFGELVVSRRMATHGLIRFDLFGLGRARKSARIIEAMADIGDTAAGQIVVIEAARIRRRSL